MLKRLLQSILRKRSQVIINRISSFIKNSEKIIDIGSGTGDVAYLLSKHGKEVTAVDVNDYHGPRLIEPIIYNGKDLPFPDKSFDTALLLMVMHHTSDPEAIFDEASRVANEIVVIETSYTNQLNRCWTIISDTLGNLRLDGFWKSYKTDEEWKSLFTRKGYKVIESTKYWDTNLGLPFLHISYYLRSN